MPLFIYGLVASLVGGYCKRQSLKYKHILICTICWALLFSIFEFYYVLESDLLNYGISNMGLKWPKKSHYYPKQVHNNPK